MSTISPTIATYDLVELLRQKNRDGYNQLYERYADTLYGIICKIVTDAPTAEDILQEIFVKVWKNINNYSAEKGSFFTWLLNITRYTAIDYLRSKQHKQKIKTQTTTDNEYIQETIYTVSNVENSNIRGLVAKLEPKYREVIDLVYFWGYTQDEVSKILDIPLGTVKTRSRMGLKLLRNNL
jgi:RNA polymerase sigma-70 factor, ECF subfamily